MLPTAPAATIPRVLRDDELRVERAYLDAAYDRVLAMRGSAERMAGTARRLTETRNVQAMFERDSAVVHVSRRLAALDIAKDRLLVGRLDLADGSCLYVGRLAVADEDGDPLVAGGPVDGLATLSPAGMFAPPAMSRLSVARITALAGRLASAVHGVATLRLPTRSGTVSN